MDTIGPDHHAEWEVYVAQRDAEQDSLESIDAEPDRAANYYEWLKWWYRRARAPGASAREIERSYIEAMQKDRHLD